VGCETIYAFIYRAYQKAEQLWRYLTHDARRSQGKSHSIERASSPNHEGWEFLNQRRPLAVFNIKRDIASYCVSES
jgi:hypothetical protein